MKIEIKNNSHKRFGEIDFGTVIKEGRTYYLKGFYEDGDDVLINLYTGEVNLFARFDIEFQERKFEVFPGATLINCDT